MNHSGMLVTSSYTEFAKTLFYNSSFPSFEFFNIQYSVYQGLPCLMATEGKYVLIPSGVF